MDVWNDLYLSVFAWNSVKPTMNSDYKNDLGRYSWRNSESIDDVSLDVLILNMPRISWHVRVLSIINHVYIHSFRNTIEATEKFNSNLVIFPGGGGIWTAFRLGEGGLEQNFSKIQMPGEFPGQGMLKLPFDWYISIREQKLEEK